MNNPMRTLAVLAFAAGLAGASQSLDIPVASGGSTSARHLNFYAPAGLNKPALVILMHGAQGNGNNLAEGWGWDSIAMREKLVVATPSSVGSFWDLGGSSDIDFITTIIDTMARRFDIDRNRVYATGWSMGGMMSYYLSCHVPEKIAAIGPSSGYLIYGQSGCSDKRNVPVYHIHGIWDDFVKYSDLHAYLANNWLGNFGCPTIPDSSKAGTRPDANTPGTTDRETWASCEKNGKKSEITLESYWKGHSYGNQESEVMWNFLRLYSLDAPVPATATIYQYGNFHGRITRLTAGDYPHVRLGKVGIPDSVITSIRVDSGLTIEFFDNDNFQTSLASHSKDAADLSAIRNKVRAIRISAKPSVPAAPGATFYQYVNYGGLNATLTEGSYALAQLQAAGIPDNAVGSMTVDSGLVVELFDGDGFATSLGSYRSSVADLATVGAGGKVTSLRISKAGGTTSAGRNRAVKAGTMRYSGGTLQSSDLQEGRLRITGIQGQSRSVVLTGGRAHLGAMPAGVFHAQLEGSDVRTDFVVLPGK